MKKLLSLLLAAAMAFTLLSAFTLSAGATELAVVSNQSPAITADVGQTVDLSKYTVVFDGDTDPTEPDTWKHGDNVINSLTPIAKGVTPLTAIAGDKTKTVYVVAKNASDKEYVLFEDDFSGYTGTADLTAAGYKLLGGEMKITNGMLEYGNTASTYAEGRILLPEWLGDFGNYDLSAEVKISTSNGRWFGPVYRISNANGSYYPYYHCCIRQDTTASSGLEFGGRNVSNSWSVMRSTSGTIKDFSQAFHKIDFTAFGDTFRLLLDGEEVFYTDQEELFQIAKADSGKPWIRIDKGYMGFIASGTKVLIKNLKVIIQETEIPHVEKKDDLLDIHHDDVNITNPLANVALVSGTDAYKTALLADSSPSQVLVEASEVGDFAELFSYCAEYKAIPDIRITAKAQADAIVDASAQEQFKDITVISSDASLLKYIRDKSSIIRTGLEVEVPNDHMTSKEAEAIRKAVRGAPATFCVIGTEHATTYNVHELQALALAVWIRADINDDSDVLKAITAGANAVITTNHRRLTALINEYFAPETLSRVPILIGHRGNPSQEPENSLASFRAAMENGADVFEIDVEITKDGHIVVMHDNTIDRTTNGSGSVNSLTLEQIKSYNMIYTVAIGSHKIGDISEEKVPTLEEVLDLLKQYPNCRMFIEFKGSNANNIPATSKIVKEYGMEDRVDVISFSSGFLAQTQQQANMPGMSTGLLASTSDASTTQKLALQNFFKSMTIAQMYNSTINNSGVSYRPYMTVANDRGMTVWPWTYNYGDNNGAFFVGAAGITTNDVQWAKDMYKFVEVNPILASTGRTVDIKAKAITFSGGEVELKSSALKVIVVSGSDVVSVSGGKITALKDGEAELLIGVSTKTKSSTAYVLYAQPVKVTVGESTGIVLEPDSGYVLNEEKNYITGVLEQTSSEDFLKGVANGYDCSFEGLSKTGLVATGTKVICGGETYTVVVRGDLNGNGKVDATDYAMAKRSVIGTLELDELQLLAGALSGGDKIKVSDYAMIKRHVLGTYRIGQ